MKLKSTKVTAASLCGALGPDDGIDPRILFSREQKNKDTTRKDRQLCKEVFKALALAIRAFDVRGALGLTIDNVSPAPDASRLRVTVSFERAVTLGQAEQAIRTLEAATGYLRDEIALSIDRKRVPELLLVLAGEEQCNEG